DLTCIYVAWPRQDFHQVRRDIEGCFHAALELIPGLREAVAAGHREARFTGTADLPSFYRASAGPGWALAGDAGHHKDPCTGMGISDAFLTADLLADAIHRGLSGNQSMDQALASYQQRRDAMTANGFELTLSTARLAPLSPRLEALYRAAADQPEIARHVLGVLGGSIPLTDLHTQARLLPASLIAPRRPVRFPSPPSPFRRPQGLAAAEPGGHGGGAVTAGRLMREPDLRGARRGRKVRGPGRPGAGPADPAAGRLSAKSAFPIVSPLDGVHAQKPASSRD